ncbi:MAG: right-handed parallel beta-helix repeat-containing protein, partial [Lentisphaeria bacterium]|nr:right-handed parallel beta-helix repeat-containing protein [Lentisphaeria bacterium]
GYSDDFATRDLAKFTTKIQPPNDKNDSKGLGVLVLKMPNGQAGTKMVVDGIVIDQSFMNSYHDTKGKPEGVETGMWLQGPAKGSKDKFASAASYSIYSETQNRYEGDVIIQNCVISNSGNFGINLSQYKGSVKILNNVFVACRMISCNVSCSNGSGTVDCEFANNTVLFSWSRTDDLGDMGYGYRCNTRVNSNVHDNIFGLNVFAGIGNDKGDSKTMKNIFNKNVFFLNKKGDVAITKSPSVLLLRVDDDAFEDMVDYPGMEDVDGNVSLKDPAAFKGAIDEAYLNAFLNASYSETTDFDENSPANQLRAALGMNLVGKIETKVSMYANRYPMEKTFKLFGAYKDYGAQAVK